MEQKISVFTSIRPAGTHMLAIVGTEPQKTLKKPLKIKGFFYAGDRI